MRITRSILAFLIVAVMFAVPALIAVWNTGQLELHGWMNRHHPGWADRFFAAFTHVADGLVPTGLALLLLAFKDVRSFLMMGLSCGLSAIVVQFLKRSVFADHHRPAMFQEQLQDLHRVCDLHIQDEIHKEIIIKEVRVDDREREGLKGRRGRTFEGEKVWSF